MFHAPNQYRQQAAGAWSSSDIDGNNGAFKITISNRTSLFCIASDGMGWEHVSIHAVTDGKDATPTWSQMCKVKDLFWDGHDCVVQFHPPESEYVNNHRHTLHLWRPTNEPIPIPSSLMVGLKNFKPEDFKQV